MAEFTESLRLAADLHVEAGDAGFRLHRRAPWDPVPFEEALSGRGSPASTRQMMAGAFYAGFARRSPEGWAPAKRPEPSLLRHVYALAGCYQTTHATPPTMRRVAERFRSLGRAEVVERCLRVAREESGHDRLALADLAALGLPARELVERLQPSGSLALVSLFRRMAGSEEPIGVFGYAYALERSALFSDAQSIEAIERVLPAGVKATRCLRVHSAVGSDAGHVAESIEFIASLPALDRATIARAMFEATSLMSLGTNYPGDVAMRTLLDTVCSDRTIVPQRQSRSRCGLRTRDATGSLY